MSDCTEIIQIAGVKDRAEAAMLAAAGATHLGFPLRLPDGREDTTEDQAREIIAALPEGAEAVLITYLTSAAEIADFCAFLQVRAVQLHGGIGCAETERLRTLMPALFVIKSLVVTGTNTLGLKDEMRAFAPFVDAYLTDTYDPASGRRGATGIVHDWRISGELARLSPRPLIVAGGLNERNVRDAIRAVRPAGVDAHSGVEGADGRKSLEQVRRFVQEARAAFAECRRALAD